MRGLTLAWAVGLGLLTWRTAQEFHRPPVPGRLAGASLVFVALAMLAEYEPARRAAVLAAWGFDLAVLFQIGPQQLTSTAGLGPPTPAQIRTHTEPPGQGAPGQTSYRRRFPIGG